MNEGADRDGLLEWWVKKAEEEVSWRMGDGEAKFSMVATLICAFPLRTSTRVEPSLNCPVREDLGVTGWRAGQSAWSCLYSIIQSLIATLLLKNRKTERKEISTEQNEN